MAIAGVYVHTLSPHCVTTMAIAGVYVHTLSPRWAPRAVRDAGDEPASSLSPRARACQVHEIVQTGVPRLCPLGAPPIANAWDLDTVRTAPSAVICSAHPCARRCSRCV